MAPAARWHGWGDTDQGRVRSSNQDAFLVDNDYSVWVVADGMGGHAGGDVASRLAVERIAELVVGDIQDPVRWLQDAVRTANDAIRQEAVKRPALNNMGTTLVALTISPQTGQAVVAHVGDSRAYVFRRGALSQLTRDHTAVEESVRKGLLTPEEALTHPYRHVLSRALGPEREIEPDIGTHHLEAGDLVLLCTDGLTKMLRDEEIGAILASRATPEGLCRALIAEANRRGGEDNVTTVLVGKS